MRTPCKARVATIIAGLTAASLATGVAAQTARGVIPVPELATGAPSVQKVVEARQYFFRVMAYEPPVVVEPVARSKASYDNPERAAVARLSAMLRGDYEAFLVTWSEASRAQFERRNRELGRGADFWRQSWEKAFGGRQLMLTQRIETGPYVFVVYRTVDPATGEPDDEVELTLPLEHQENGRWLATQELSRDPVLLYWKTPGHTIETMVRGISGR